MGVGEVPPFARQITLLKVAYICAMRWEADCLPGQANVRCAGIGAQRAGQAAEVAVADGADLLVSFGSAAGLDRQLCSGDLLLTTQVGVDLSALGGRQAACRQGAAEILHELEPRDGVIVQSSVLLTTEAQKKTLYQTTGASAVDMESAAIAAVARRHQRLFFALRVILDDAYTAVPSALVQACDVYGKVKIMRMCAAVIKRPALVSVFPGLARAQRKASATLSAAAGHLVSDTAWR